MQRRSQEIGMQGMDARVRDRQPARHPPGADGRSPQNPDFLEPMPWQHAGLGAPGQGLQELWGSPVHFPTLLLPRLLPETSPDQPSALLPPALPKSNSHNSKSCCYLIVYYVPGTVLRASMFISLSFNNLRKEVILCPFYR